VRVEHKEGYEDRHGHDATMFGWPRRRRASAALTVVSFVAFGVFAAALSPLFAQAPAIPKVEFDDAIKQALDRNPTVGQAATAIGRAESLLEQSRAATRFNISASALNLTLDHSRGFEGLVTQPIDQATFGANVTYPFLAFSRWAAVAQAKDQVDVAKFSVADVRRAIAESAAEAYLAVITAHRQVDVDERALAAAQAHLDFAQKRLDAGAGSRVNQLRAAGEVSTDQSRLETTRLGVLKAQEALGVLLVAGGPVDVGAEPSFDLPAGTSDQDISGRTDLQLQIANQHAAEHVFKDSKKDWYPVASASFVPQIVEPAGLFQPSKTWSLSISLTQPIFTGGLQKALARERQIAVDFSKLAVAAVDNQAKSDVRVAEQSVQSYVRSSASARTAADQANQVLQITTTAFEVGATTNIEVIDAQRSARDAETAATQADDAVRRARLDLLVALGKFPR